jgi:hypothetical protein
MIWIGAAAVFALVGVGPMRIFSLIYLPEAIATFWRSRKG